MTVAIAETYPFVRGVLDGEIRTNIAGCIYMVPYYDDAGHTQWQTYNRESLDSLLSNAKGKLRALKAKHSILNAEIKVAHNRITSLLWIEDRIIRCEKDVDELQKISKAHKNNRTVFLFYNDSARHS